MASRNSRSRMIYWKISYCKQLAKCSILAQLLFTWLIPNTDDLGRMEGDPEIIKGMIFPYHHEVKLLPGSELVELSFESIAAALQELKDQDLIVWYEVSDCWYISFPKFSTYQKLRKDRTYDSDYPSPASYVKTCHDTARQDTKSHDMECLARAPAEGEVKEKRIEEGDAREGEIYKFFNLNISPITPFQSQVISQNLDDGLEPELILEILKDCQGKREKWSWADKVMTNSLLAGIKTLQQYRAKRQEQEEAKNRTGGQQSGVNTGDNKQSKFSGIDKSKFLAKPKG